MKSYDGLQFLEWEDSILVKVGVQDSWFLPCLSLYPLNYLSELPRDTVLKALRKIISMAPSNPRFYTCAGQSIVLGQQQAPGTLLGGPFGTY
jgi:hypothetical protein